MRLIDLTIKKFHEGLLKKEFSAVEVVQAFIKRIREKDKDVGAYLYLMDDLALLEASKIDNILARDDKLGILAGVPLAVKDNILIKGFPTTAASKILKDYIAVYDATVVKKLKQAGVIFLGKTNLDEFAMGSSTENSAFQLTRNYFDLERVPGGSSGGSAVAVSASLAMAALGSDTGGSIRQPASFCGVVGLKPTYGTVSRFGLIAMASSLDQIGPITRTVEDAEIVFNAIRGRDFFDATSCDVQYDTKQALKLEDLKHLTIGLPKEYFNINIDSGVQRAAGLSREVESSIDEAIKLLKSLGVNFKEISLPHTKYALATYYIIMPAEVSANLARFDGIRYSRKEKKVHSNLSNLYMQIRSGAFGEEVKRRIILGTFVLSSGYYDAYYIKAQKVRHLIRKDFEKAFEEVDMILTPVSPTTAFKIGEKMNDPLAMYLSDIFTITVNLAGLPALSIPVKDYLAVLRNIEAEEKAGSPLMEPQTGSRRDVNELPVGFQLIGKPFREEEILGVGRYYEKLVLQE
jgi:aspartyl-tRNA(Asn)/glutamyl-tRNA(Gln) amidotransferase subunit A